MTHNLIKKRLPLLKMVVANKWLIKTTEVEEDTHIPTGQVFTTNYSSFNFTTCRIICLKKSCWWVGYWIHQSWPEWDAANKLIS